MPSTILEFTLLVIGGFMKENSLVPLYQRKLVPPKWKVPKKFEIYPAPSYKIREKILASTKTYVWVAWRVYTMENKDTNTNYQKVVRVGDKK